MTENAAGPQIPAATTEHHIALREAHCHTSAEAFFEARPQRDSTAAWLDFEAGYTRGFDDAAALAAKPGGGQ